MVNPHVLIRTNPKNIEHKYEDVISKKVENGKKFTVNDIVCYWTLSNPPKMTLWLGSVKGVEGKKIMFTDGKYVIAEGKILEVKPRMNGKPGEIIFTPLKRVKYPQPKTAPTRGFTYVYPNVEE